MSDTAESSHNPTAADQAAPGQANEAARPQPALPRLRWNLEGLRSTYANFANANSTREEVVLNFGLNKSWDRGGQHAEVELNHRIVMSPFAAKRLCELLGKLVGEYETRYGKLD